MTNNIPSQVIHQLGHGHPYGKLLVLGNVSNFFKVTSPQFFTRNSQDGCFSGIRSQDVEQHPYRRGFTRTVRSEKGVDRALANRQVQFMDGIQPPETSGQLVRFDYR